MSLNVIEAEIEKLKGIAETVRSIAERPISRANFSIINLHNRLAQIRESDAELVELTAKLPDFVRTNLSDLQKVEAEVTKLTRAIDAAKSSRARLDSSVDGVVSAVSQAGSSITAHINEQLG